MKSEFEFDFEVNLRTQVSLMRQMFVTGYGWRLLAGFPLVALLSVLAYQVLKPPIRGYFLAFIVGWAFTLIVIWVKTAILYERLARDTHTLVGDGKVSVTLSDSGLETRGDYLSRRVSWEKMTRIRRTRGFVILYGGVVPIVGIPRASLPDEAGDFLDQMIKDAP